MADLDAELLERAVRWCAEAGRTATPATLRRALSGLGWEELLTVRALLADPPPVRPLGPFALADLARGAPADVAAERERGGRYPSERGDPRFGEPSALEARSPPSPPLVSKRKGARRGKGPGMVIRRARDAAPATPAALPAPPLVEELLLAEGRTVLERLLREHGARRKALVDAL
ncbi:MAG TPA: Fis family transcriptional regulator, partial [Anaeromyxobacter sp.]